MITAQAIVISIAFIVVLIVFALNILVSKQSSSKDKLMVFLFIISVIIPLMVLKVCVVQCMINGDCQKLAWFISGVAVIIAMMYLVTFVLKIAIKKKAEEKDMLLQPLEQLDPNYIKN